MKLKILSLNMMHGRNAQNSVFPIFLSKKTVVNNIRNVAKFIKKINPDIVALQEVDYYSITTGNIDQLEEIAKQAGYKYKFYSKNFSIGVATFGTAILSKYLIVNPEAHNFPFAFPTPRKGFAVAEIRLPNRKRLLFSSVHMTWINYLRKKHRHKEAEILIKELLEYRKENIVIAGDFNSNFKMNERTMNKIITKLDLHTYKPAAERMFTHPSIKPEIRIDWIIASNNIKFDKYRTYLDKISDHLPVYAEISL